MQNNNGKFNLSFSPVLHSIDNFCKLLGENSNTLLNLIREFTITRMAAGILLFL